MFISKWKNVPSFMLYTTRRYKSIKKFWSQSSKKTTNVERALTHFDDFYGSVFGSRWEPMKKALFKRQKYVAVTNCFGDGDETKNYLEKLGAYNIRLVFEGQKKFNDNCEISEKSDNANNKSQDNYIENYASQISHKEIDEIYGEGKMSPPSQLDVGNTVIKNNSEEFEEMSDTKDVVQLSLTAKLKDIDPDESRLIDPKIGMSASALWTFVPATRLKGREDWLPESHFYSYYNSVKAFPLNIEKEDEIRFPEHLNIFSYEPDSKSSFPESKRGLTGVMNYYMMDGASLLPVLALGLNAGDRVLDLCAAPGGKSLVMLQTLLPEILVLNDYTLSRVNRIYSVLREFLIDFDTNNKWRERIIVTQADGRYFKDQNGFDKVLVDVPCTTDRHSAKENSNSIFNVNRIKERLKIPEMQSQLLSNALKLCRVGGTVVYSTCTFCPIQNDGVVHMALKSVWESDGIQATIKDLSTAVKPAYSLYRFGAGRAAPKYGQLIIPHRSSNFGPMYFAKMVRTH